MRRTTVNRTGSCGSDWGGTWGGDAFRWVAENLASGKGGDVEWKGARPEKAQGTRMCKGPEAGWGSQVQRVGDERQGKIAQGLGAMDGSLGLFCVTVKGCQSRMMGFTFLQGQLGLFLGELEVGRRGYRKTCHYLFK